MFTSYSYFVPDVSWWSFLRTSTKPFTCFLGCILDLSTALVITSTLGVLFLASLPLGYLVHALTKRSAQ